LGEAGLAKKRIIGNKRRRDRPCSKKKVARSEFNSPGKRGANCASASVCVSSRGERKKPPRHEIGRGEKVERDHERRPQESCLQPGEASWKNLLNGGGEEGSNSKRGGSRLRRKRVASSLKIELKRKSPGGGMSSSNYQGGGGGAKSWEKKRTRLNTPSKGIWPNGNKVSVSQEKKK